MKIPPTRRSIVLSAAILIVVFTAPSVSQTHLLSGTIRDASTDELLPFANLLVGDLSIGTAADGDGRFRLMLKTGTHDLITSLVGYKTDKRRIDMKDGSMTLNIRLVPTDILLQEVTVYSSAAQQSLQTEVATLSLQSQRIIETTTVIPDVFRSVQTLPGISSDNEFSAKFDVRGGTPDENLVLVNGAQVYEPFHVKEAPNASIGIFNTDMMKKVTLVTGGFSAKYGDRMSAVMDIEYREGNREKMQGLVTLSMTNFDLLLEGPVSSKGSFILGARKSYVEYAMSLMHFDQSIRPSFYDIQGVVTYNLSPKDKLSFEFVHSGDTFNLDPQSSEGFPNIYNGQYKGKSATYRDVSSSYDEENDHYISDLFDIQSSNFISATAFLKGEISYYEQIEDEYSFSSDDFSRDIASTPNYFYRSSQEHLYSNALDIRTLETKGALEMQLTPSYELNLGASLQRILYSEQLVDRSTIDEQMNTAQYPDTTTTHRVASAVDAANEGLDTQSFKVALYAENVMQLGEQIILNLGGRLDYFDVNKDLTLSPRINLAYRFLDQTTVRGAWGFYYQSPIYRQIAYSVASDTNTKAQKAIHYVLGVEHVIPFDPTIATSLTFKLEAYFKRYANLISSQQTSSGRITYSRKNDATGSARGLDLYVALNLTNFYGWLSYGLLDAREDLLGDKLGEYPRFTDQRHTVSFVGTWILGSQWSTDLRIQYGSGYAYTPSVAQYNSQKRQWEWIQGNKNSATLPPYRRVDVRVGKDFKVFGLSASAFLDISNVFNFTNTQSYRYRFNSNGSPYIEQITLWPILPTFGLTTKF